MATVFTLFGLSFSMETVAIATFVILLVMRFSRMASSSLTRNANVDTTTLLPSANQTRNLILGRRTVMPKEYQPGEKLSPEEINLILEAANWAPTHQKNEPWRFAILDSAQSIHEYLDFLEQWYTDQAEKISDEDLKKFKNKLAGVRNEWPEKVSHLLILGMRRQAQEKKRLPEWEEICAVAMSVQNMHLMSTALERVGGFWSSHTWCRHARDSPELKQSYFGDLLDDPEDRVLGAFVLGKYAKGKSFRSARSDIELKCCKIGRRE